MRTASANSDLREVLRWVRVAAALVAACLVYTLPSLSVVRAHAAPVDVKGTSSASVRPHTATKVAGWPKRSVELRGARHAVVKVRVSHGPRPVRVQKWTARGWRTVKIVKAPARSAPLLVRVGPGRWRLDVPATRIWPRASTRAWTVSSPEERMSIQPKPTPTPTPTPTQTTAWRLPAEDAGARLPASVALASLPARKIYVSTDGSDAAGSGTSGAPVRTLAKAVALASAGDAIVVRGGTYPMSGNAVFIGKSGLSIVAYPGETPTFDGSVPAPVGLASEGVLRYFPYDPMPATVGEGLGLRDLPPALFDSTGAPTGLAQERGWRCVSGASIELPAPSASDPDGCPSSMAARVISGLYPDQVWAGTRALTEVLDKRLVVPGTFWVDRSQRRLYLSSSDAAEGAGLRVSSFGGARPTPVLGGTFIQANAENVRIEGLRFIRNSPAWNSPTIYVSSPRGFILRDVEFRWNSGISVKIAGGQARDGSQLVNAPLIERVTVMDAGWMGAVINYADDAHVVSSRFERINAAREFSTAPQSGAIKVMKSDRTLVSDSRFESVQGHGLWFDQSNYKATVVGNRFVNNSHSSVFFEISYGLLLADNYIYRDSSIPAEEEAHSAVRLAGSGGLRVVNNTIVGSPVGVGVYADVRSKRYDSDGNGLPDRWCAEHGVRTGAGGNPGADCNVPYVSDFDMSRSPAQTPGLTWMPSVDVFLNNVVANQGDRLQSGWTPCGGRTPVCVVSHVSSLSIDVAPAAIFGPSALVDGNVYQTTGSRIAALGTRAGTRASGAFSAATIADLAGALGAAPFGLSAEARGVSGVGLVERDGRPTASLTSKQGQAAPVPTMPDLNRYIPAGTRHYGIVASD